MPRHSFRKLALAHDGGSEHGVRRRDTRPHTERVDKVEGGNEPVYKGGGDEPAVGHDGDEENEETLPVPPHVCFGEFDADGKDLDDEDDAGEFEGDLVGVAPCKGIEQVERYGPEDDAHDRCYRCTESAQTEKSLVEESDWGRLGGVEGEEGKGSVTCFADVELLFDEEGDEGKDADKPAEDGVCKMHRIHLHVNKVTPACITSNG
jgi:hypothetical protein